jgi:hypothetical protein
MNWDFSHNITDKILVVNTEGILDISSANKMRAEGMELIRQHRYLRCLLDHTKAKGITLSTLEIYNLPKIYNELNVPHGFRMALVVSDTMREDLDFYETVCKNNGYSVSVFFDYVSALNWLKG